MPQEKISYPDIKVSEEFLHSHQELLLYAMYSLVEAAMKTAGAIDTDAVVALEALIQTHRTLESGLVYETRAENSVAASIQRLMSKSLEDYQNERAKREALSAVRNSEILAVLVFLHRLGQLNQNGRPRGRMFLDFLKEMVPAPRVEERAPSIIL